MTRGRGTSAAKRATNSAGLSFAHNYNNVVRVVRSDPNLQRDLGTLAQEAANGGSTVAGAVFNGGDVLYPKIA